MLPQTSLPPQSIPGPFLSPSPTPPKKAPTIPVSPALPQAFLHAVNSFSLIWQSLQDLAPVQPCQDPDANLLLSLTLQRHWVWSSSYFIQTDQAQYFILLSVQKGCNSLTSMACYAEKPWASFIIQIHLCSHMMLCLLETIITWYTKWNWCIGYCQTTELNYRKFIWDH